jgi:hypothetical protein
MPWIQRNNLFLYFVSKLKLEFIFIFIYLSICRRRNRCDLVRERNKPVRIKFTSIVFGNKKTSKPHIMATNEIVMLLVVEKKNIK